MIMWFKRILSLIVLILILLLIVAIIRTYTIPSRQIQSVSSDQFQPSDSALLRLSQGINYPTITPAIPEERDSSVFKDFHQFLEKSYPATHQVLSKKVFKEMALLYKWEGSNKSLKPFLLMAHQDVVPVDDSLLWEVHPFSGKRVNGFIYGRGALDIKSGLLGIMEAIESLIKEGYKPDRTIYLAFGHDEESGVGDGAKTIAAYLQEQNTSLEFVLDEGGLILKEALPGLTAPVALIGIAEKGFANVEVVSKGHGGHSSMPADETAVTRLAKAISKINENPIPASLDGPASALFDYAGTEMKFPFNVLFTNRWLFEPVIKNQMAKTPSGNAAIRTTVATTMLQGSSKENVIPSEAKAVINSRLMPGTNAEDLITHLSGVVDDTMIQFKVVPGHQEASVVSDTSSMAFRNIRKCIAAIYPHVVTAPFLLVALTDSRHFQKVAENVYRFHPVVYKKSDLERLHGRNERIRETDYKNVIRFYRDLILEYNK